MCIIPETRRWGLLNDHYEVFAMLKKEGEITDAIIDKLMKCRHSGFNTYNGLRISREDEKGRKSVAQYILRNPFSYFKGGRHVRVELESYLEKGCFCKYYGLSAMQAGHTANLVVQVLRIVREVEKHKKILSDWRFFCYS